MFWVDGKTIRLFGVQPEDKHWVGDFMSDVAAKQEPASLCVGKYL